MHVFTPTIYAAFCVVGFLHSIQLTKSSSKLQQYRYILFDVETHSAGISIGSEPHDKSGIQTRTEIECIKNECSKHVSNVAFPCSDADHFIPNALVTNQVGVMTTYLAQFLFVRAIL